MEITYSPQDLMEAYECLSHGKPRLGGIREAIRQADENQDIAYQIYFRGELCIESSFYDDHMDTLLTFPEMLALVDANPNAPVAEESDYSSNLDDVLWKYKWLLEDATYFYQISMADAERFAEDFKRRYIAAGYSLRPYYFERYLFYREMDDARAENSFHLFEQAPRDFQSDCRACEQNDIVSYYLRHDEFDKAVKLARSIENRTLSCGGADSWLTLKCNYLSYYIRKKDFAQAEQMIKLIHRYRDAYRRFDISVQELRCYVYTDLSKALRIYKENWKKWLHERTPAFAYEQGSICCLFFKKLGETRKRQTVKIAYDAEFPLYQQENSCRILELYDYYYQFICDLAEKFDARNGNDAYQQRLQKMLEEV